MASWDIDKITYKDSIMYMWVVNGMVPDAIRLADAWNFEMKQVAYVWDKVIYNRNDFWYPHRTTELCFVFRKKNSKFILKEWIGSKNEKQFHVEERGEHSVKPLHFRESITRMYPNLEKLEMFARMNLEEDSQGTEGSPITLEDGSIFRWKRLSGRDVRHRQNWEKERWTFWGFDTRQDPDNKIMNPPNDEFFVEDKQYDKDKRDQTEAHRNKPNYVKPSSKRMKTKKEQAKMVAKLKPM